MVENMEESVKYLYKQGRCTIKIKSEIIYIIVFKHKSSDLNIKYLTVSLNIGDRFYNKNVEGYSKKIKYFI